MTMRLHPRFAPRAILVGVLVALVVPAIALGQTADPTDSTAAPAAGSTPAQIGAQSGTTGDGDGAQSGDVTNGQSNEQDANGNSGNVQQNATNQNCVAGRDCVNNNITNQNQTVNEAPTRTRTVSPARPHRVFETVRPAVRTTHVRTVPLAFTGLDLRELFAIGSLITAAGFGVLMMARRRRWSTD
jgi:hypothetical protein